MPMLMQLRPRVAIVGAGVAGSICAHLLGSKGYVVDVYDLGRAFPGGRSSTRRDPIDPHRLFDHGAQFIRPFVDEPSHVLEHLASKGYVQPWEGRTGIFDAMHGNFAPKTDDSYSALSGKHTLLSSCLKPGIIYVGNASMDRLAKELTVPPVNLHLGTKVTSASWVPDERAWHLGVSVNAKAGETGGSKPADPLVYDALVTTDVLVGKPGSPGFIDFESAPETITGIANRIGKLSQASLFTLMVEFPQVPGKPLLPFDAALIVNSEFFQWIANDASKPGRPQGERWVAITTEEAAQQLLGKREAGAPLPPQSPEYLDERKQMLLSCLLRELEKLTGSPLPAPLFSSVHRWGSAYATQTLGVPCAVVPEARFVAAGDFCNGGGVVGALESGNAAADAVILMLGQMEPSPKI